MVIPVADDKVVADHGMKRAKDTSRNLVRLVTTSPTKFKRR
jgi:hypothetical protein